MIPPRSQVALAVMLALFPLLAPVTAALRAADVPAQTAVAKPAPPAGFSVKTRSHFSAEPGTRNPFWPIGWVKPGPATPQVVQIRQPVLDVSPDLFNVTGIVLGNPNLAVINGRDYAEGDPITVKVGDTPVQLTVFRIRDGEVALNFRGREVKVRLRVR
jgi:hypothetical protein